MFKKLLISFFILISTNVNSNENLLTIQQQLERLQREVSDISKSVFSNNSSVDENNNIAANNLSAIDMRIYDLEKDVKKINADLEEILFQIEDITKVINNFESQILLLNDNLSKYQNQKLNVAQSNQEQVNNIEEENNTLGSLKITTSNNNENSAAESNEIEDQSENKLTPEDQFQQAFDNIRNKKWIEAKSSLKDFISENPENQLSGSAHYWLGELHILEKKYRDAALIFAEGYQKFPNSIKAPDMLFKLSQSLLEVNKKKDVVK